MPNTIVQLDTPLVGHEAITRLEFREPTFAEYSALGEPYVWAPTGEGQGRVRATPLWTVVREYAEALLVKPAEKAMLNQVSIRDSRKIKDAILDFFLESDPLVEASSTSQTTSSSSSVGDPATSPA